MAAIATTPEEVFTTAEESAPPCTVVGPLIVSYLMSFSPISFTYTSRRLSPTLLIISAGFAGHSSALSFTDLVLIL